MPFLIKSCHSFLAPDRKFRLCFGWFFPPRVLNFKGVHYHISAQNCTSAHENDSWFGRASACNVKLRCVPFLHHSSVHVLSQMAPLKDNDLTQFTALLEKEGINVRMG